MDFTLLRNTVESQYDPDSKTFHFASASYGSSDITALLNDFVKKLDWVITDMIDPPKVDEAAQTISLAGKVSGVLDLTAAQATMTFFLKGDKAQLLFATGLGLDWSFISAFPMLAGSVFENFTIKTDTQAYYCYASQPFTDTSRGSVAFEQGRNFYALITPTGGVFDTLGGLFGTIATGSAAGPLLIGKNGPTMDLVLDLGLVATLQDKFPLLTNGVELLLRSEFTDDGWSITGLEVATHFDFGDHNGLRVAAILNPWTFKQILFVGTFENVSLPSFSGFATEYQKLVGATDLGDQLPGDYGSHTGLSLERISLGLDVTNFMPVSADIRIGTPPTDPGWALGDVATVKGITFYAGVSNPFAGSESRSVRIVVEGEIELPTSATPLDMIAGASAQFGEGGNNQYSVYADLAPGHDAEIPIANMLGKYLPAAKDAPSIFLRQLGFDLRFQTSAANHYGFYAALDEEKPATFTFGGAKAVVLKSGSFRIANDANEGSWGGVVKGAVELFDIASEFDYVLPGDFAVTAHFPEFEIDVGELIHGLVAPGWTPPSWMPVIPFPKTDLYLAHRSSNNTDTLALRSQPEFGTIVLQAIHVNSQWGFAAGLDLDVQKIAAFAGLDMLSGMDDLFVTGDLIFVFTSIDLPGGFQFPPSTAFPKATGKTVALPNWVQSVQAGFYFYASMNFNFAASPNLQLVVDMFSLEAAEFELFVFIGENPEQNARAQAQMSGDFIIDGKSFGSVTGYVGAEMEAGVPKFFVEGAVTVDVNDDAEGGTTLTSCDPSLSEEDKLTAALAFELSENAAYLTAAMKGQISFGPVTLAQLVLVVGIDFEGIPSLGMAASIDLAAYDTTYDSSIAFFFDSGNPQNSLFAGSVSDIHLGQVLTTIVGEITGGDKPPPELVKLLDNIALEGTHSFNLAASAEAALNSRDYAAISSAFNDAMREAGYADEVTFSQATTMIVVGGAEGLPNGQWFITDYPSSNVIKHYELKLENDVIHVAIEAQLYYCNPPGGGTITLGPPSNGIRFNSGIYVSGKLKFFMLEIDALVDIRPNQGIIADVAIEKPLNIVTIPGTQTPVLKLASATDPDRGPYFSLATFDQGETKRHVTLNGIVSFLGLVSTQVDIDISDKGLHLDFESRTGTDKLGSTIIVDAEIDSASDFEFDFSADVHIDHPDFSLFSVDLGTIDLKAKVACELKFGEKDGKLYLLLDGAHFEFGDHRFGLPKVELSVGTDELSDLPGIIFDMVKQAIWDFVSDVGNWLEWVGSGIIAGVADVEKVLEDFFHAIGSVWSADKRIVVAVSQSYAASQAFSVTITPSTPTPGVTQEMIDEAELWSRHELEHLVAAAAIVEIQQIPPEDVAGFKVNVLDHIDEEIELEYNQTWVMRPNGPMPSLLDLGFIDPMQDERFFRRSVRGRKFRLELAVDGDFRTSLKQVEVQVRYAGEQVGGTVLYTSNAAQLFEADWDDEAGTNFDVTYTATYQDSSKPAVTSPWFLQKGEEVGLLVQDGAEA